MPFIEKAAWRFMQFDPENFPVQDWKFVPSSTLGMLAREVEQMQFINLLKTLGPNSPVVPILLQGIVENSSLGNKQQILQSLAQSSQQQAQMQQQEKQMQMQMLMQTTQATNTKTMSEAKEREALATKHMVEAQVEPQVAQAKLMAALSTNLPDDDDQLSIEFDRRVKIAELMLKEEALDMKKADMQDNKEIVKLQMSKK